MDDDAEADAELLRQRTGCYDWRTPPSEVARRLPGIHGVALVSGRMAQHHRGELRPWRDGWYVCVSSRASVQAQRFAVVHELVHYVFPAKTEAAVNACAAAFLMPRHDFREAVLRWGADVNRIAEHFVVSATAAAIRFGEVTYQPSAVVTKHHAWARGAPWEWGDVHRIVRAYRPPRGLALVKLDDWPGRFLLVADDLALEEP